MKNVSVVIPTYNGRTLLQQNLPSVLKGLHKNDEVVIVDDASSDDTISWLLTTFHISNSAEQTTDYDVWKTTIADPQPLSLMIIKNRHNLRFGASANRGVAHASSQLVLLLNNDVSLHDDTLDYLVPHFSDPQMFAVGCHEIESNQGGVSGGKNRLWFERGLFWHNRADTFETGDTAWASGGSAMFDRQKWLELGGFDPMYYPAYWEDVDLSFRARKKGWRVLFEAKAKVDHNHETTNQTVFGQSRIAAMSRKNALAFSWKHGTFLQKLSFLVWLPRYWFIK